MAPSVPADLEIRRNERFRLKPENRPKRHHSLVGAA